MAAARYASSTEWLRSSWMPCHRFTVSVPSRLRIRYHAMNTTIDQPIPIKSRLAPVMLASASPHGDSSPPPGGGRQAGPVASNEFPPCHAKTKSTAYSGRTAMSASTAIANPAEMSSCATSAAHDRMNAAPTMARPNSAASSACGRSGAAARTTSAGTAAAIASTSAMRCREGRMSVSSSSGTNDGSSSLVGRRSRPRLSGGSPGRDARP